MSPAFFDLKLHKWDTLENETIELFARLRSSPFSFSFISQTEFTIFEKYLINRGVPLCFWWGWRCQFIKIIPLPLDKFSSFLLVSLISSWKSWSLRSITLDNTILILLSVSYSLMEESTFLIFWRVFTLFWVSNVLVRIIIKIKLLSSLSQCTVVLSFFLPEVVWILLLSLVSVLTSRLSAVTSHVSVYITSRLPAVIGHVSVYTTSPIRLSILNYSITLMVK